MPFTPFRNRVTSTPNRYKLTAVSSDTYDFERIPGTVSDEGTPLNADNMNKLVQRDGDDIKDTVTTFTESTTRENIATGEKTSTIFGKIKKWFTDLKAHAFNNLATTQGTQTDVAPSNKLLKESTFSRVYTSFAELGLSASTATPVDVANAMVDFSKFEAQLTYAQAPNLVPNTGLAMSGRFASQRVANATIEFTYSQKEANSQRSFLYIGNVRLIDSSNQWSGWKQIISTDNISTVMPLSSASASNSKVLGEKVVYDEFALKAPLANPTFTGTVTVPAPTNPTDAARLQDVNDIAATISLASVVKQPNLTYLVYAGTSATTNTLLFAKHASTEYTITINWGDGTSQAATITTGSGSQAVVKTANYAGDGHYLVVISGTFGGFQVNGGTDNLKYIEVYLGTNCPCGDYSFASCNNLQKVEFATGWDYTVLGNSAFYETSIKEIVIPSTITTISNACFYRCKINFIDIPNSVTTIGNSAFYITLLESVRIPNSVTTIGNSAFYICTRLKHIHLGNGITSIGSWAFRQGTFPIPQTVYFYGNPASITVESDTFDGAKIVDVIATSTTYADAAVTTITSGGGSLLTNYRKLY